MSRDRLLQPAPVALLSLATIVALLLADVISLARFREARAYADRTSDISITLHKTLTAMVDAETASRGFLLTGDASYLEAFEQAEREVPQAFATLRGFTSDSPLQLRRVAELERLSTARLAFMKETIRLVTAGRTDAAIAAVREGTGKRLMGQVRGVASNMAADEDGLLRRRIASAESGYRLSMGFLVVAGVALLGLGTILFAIDRDVQKRRSLERSLQGAVRAREQMLAIVSHDLRNPLSVVMMAAKLIERCAGPDPSGDRLKKHANAISHEVERMNRLVTDLLDMSKIEAGRSLHVELARHDGAELLKQSVELLEPLARARGLTLAVDVPPGVLRPRLRRRASAPGLVESDRQRHEVRPGRGRRLPPGLLAQRATSSSRSATRGPESHKLKCPTSSTRTGRPARAGAAPARDSRSSRRSCRHIAGASGSQTEEGTGSSFICALPAAARNELQQIASSEPREPEPYDIEQASCTRGTA